MRKNTICNLDFSRKVLIYGLTAIGIIIIILLFLESSFSLNSQSSSYAVIVAISTGLLSFLMSIVSLYDSREQAKYNLAYENSKKSTIYFFNLIKHLTSSQLPKNKIKCFDIILEKKIDLEFVKYLNKWEGVGVSKDGLVYKFFLDDLIKFKEENMIYDLPQDLVYAIDAFLEDKTELSDEDMDEIIKYVKNYLTDEFKMFIP